MSLALKLWPEQWSTWHTLLSQEIDTGSMSCQAEYRGLFISKAEKKVDNVLFALNAAFFKKKMCNDTEEELQLILQGLFLYRLVMSKVIFHQDFLPFPSYTHSQSLVTGHQCLTLKPCSFYRFTKQAREGEKCGCPAFLSPDLLWWH